MARSSLPHVHAADLSADSTDWMAQPPPAMVPPRSRSGNNALLFFAGVGMAFGGVAMLGTSLVVGSVVIIVALNANTTHTRPVTVAQQQMVPVNQAPSPVISPPVLVVPTPQVAATPARSQRPAAVTKRLKQTGNPTIPHHRRQVAVAATPRAATPRAAAPAVVTTSQAARTAPTRHQAVSAPVHTAAVQPVLSEAQQARKLQEEMTLRDLAAARAARQQASQPTSKIASMVRSVVPESAASAVDGWLGTGPEVAPAVAMAEPVVAEPVVAEPVVAAAPSGTRIQRIEKGPAQPELTVAAAEPSLHDQIVIQTGSRANGEPVLLGGGSAPAAPVGVITTATDDLSDIFSDEPLPSAPGAVTVAQAAPTVPQEDSVTGRIGSWATSAKDAFFGEEEPEAIAAAPAPIERIQKGGDDLDFLNDDEDMPTAPGAITLVQRAPVVAQQAAPAAVVAEEPSAFSSFTTAAKEAVFGADPTVAAATTANNRFAPPVASQAAPIAAVAASAVPGVLPTAPVQAAPVAAPAFTGEFGTDSASMSGFRDGGSNVDLLMEDDLDLDLTERELTIGNSGGTSSGFDFDDEGPEDLTMDSFLVTVRTSSPGVEVFVDGRSVGFTPTGVELTPGNHTVKLQQGNSRGVFELTASGPAAWCFQAKGKSFKSNRCL